MRTLSSVLATALFAALMSTAAPAQAQTPTVSDSGVLVVYDHDVPVAHEKFIWQNFGDSLVVSATARRTLADDTGEKHPYEKNMMVVVDSRDLGLLRYQSDQKFQGQTAVRGILPGDTAFTYYTEFESSGSAERYAQPPGRLFVIDTPMFSLFDVLLRSLAGKDFTTRRMQLLVASTDTLSMPLATITRADPETVLIGERRLPAQHFILVDPSVQFELWADTKGRLLRLSHLGSGMRVERKQPALPAKPALRKRTTVKR